MVSVPVTIHKMCLTQFLMGKQIKLLVVDILISTIDSGIDKIRNVLLPFRPDIKYIVSHQFTDEKFKIIPIELKRNDVIVSQIPGRGVTKSKKQAAL